ncbi:MAG: ABC transporter ATP-binding protein [Gammaproteobacteria bacterium]
MRVHLRRDRRDTAPSANGSLLELSDLTVRFGHVVAVRGISLTVERGEIVTLLGANGAGKSSTLNAVVGLAPVAGGRVTLAGQDITSLPPESVVRRRVALVPEGRRVFANLTVAENLRLGAAAVDRSEYEDTLPEVLDLFPVVKQRLGTKAGLFSGGEQQQLAIARALMGRPQLVLLDEPSLGLAPIMVAKVFELIAGLRDRGVTILLVEQNAERALEVADRAYVLSTGRLEVSGQASSLASDSIEEAYLGISAGRG